MKLNKLLLLLATLMLMSCSSNSLYSKTYFGMITDSQGTPISGFTLDCNGSRSVSDGQGIFIVKVFDDRKIKIKGSCPGYGNISVEYDSIDFINDSFLVLKAKTEAEVFEEVHKLVINDDFPKAQELLGSVSQSNARSLILQSIIYEKNNDIKKAKSTLKKVKLYFWNEDLQMYEDFLNGKTNI